VTTPTVVQADPVRDTPGSAMSLLERRVTLSTVGILVGLAALAWYLTVRQAAAMTGMVTGLSQVGTRAPADIAPIIFMAMWLTMMVAMMFPTVAPMVLVHRAVVQRRGEGWAPTATFIVGYLLVWTAIGLLPLAAFVALRNLRGTGTPNWLVIGSAAALVAAGLYQFTPWKRLCLRACRTPFAFVIDHDFGGGNKSALRAGISHGAYCLGCCWALMLVLIVVGLMNLAWMAAIALIFLAEKNWRYGVALTRLAGTAVTALGFAVLIYPGLLTWLSGGTPPSAMGGHM